MKKFLLLLVTVMMTTLTFAQGRAQKHNLFMGAAKMERPVQKQFHPTTPLKYVKPLENPASVFGTKKSSRRAAIPSLEDLGGDYVAIHALYGSELAEGTENQYQTVAKTNPSSTSASVTIEVIDNKTINIHGIEKNATLPVKATVDVSTGTFSIADGQPLWTFDYQGSEIVFKMSNATTAGAAITGTIEEGNTILFDNLWVVTYEMEGETYPYSDYYYTSIVPANGTMAFQDAEGEHTANVFIFQDEESKACMIYNFGGFGVNVAATLSSDKTFYISSDQDVLDEGETYGKYYPTGLKTDGSDLMDLVGKGTDNTLTSDVNWTLYSSQGYWFGLNGPFTITYDDVFAYPEAEVGELVVKPEGLVTKAYPFSAICFEGNQKVNYNATIQIGWASETEVYIQGLDKDLLESWVKGTYNAEKRTITIAPTYMGKVGETPHFIGAYGETGAADLVLDYYASTDTYEFNGWVQLYKGLATDTYSYYYRNFFIGEETVLTVNEEGMKLAVDAQLAGSYYPAEAQSEADAVSVSKTIKVITYGNYLMIQGLFDLFPNAWITGEIRTVSETSKGLYIYPNQLLGTAEDGFKAYLVGYYQGAASYPLMFTYDEANAVFTSVNPGMLTRIKSGMDYYGLYSAGMTITLPKSDGISTIAADKVQKSEGAWYTIGGQRVAQPTQKGLYIHNGRKVVIK